jgi:signal transduction histidine kinase
MKRKLPTYISSVRQGLSDYQLAVFSALILVAALCAVFFIWMNLRAVEQNRLQLFQTLTLGIGETPVKYVLHKDNFELRKAIILSLSFGAAMLVFGTAFQVFLITKTFRELKQQSSAKSLMISTITHNARHYLAVLKGRLDLLNLRMEHGTGLLNLEDDLMKMLENTMALNRLVDLLNDNELLRQGKMRVNPVPIRIEELLSQVGSNIEDLFESKHVRVKIKDARKTVSPLLADRHGLEQVLMNLLHNAGKFSPQDGTISVCLEADEKKQYMRICDHGPGIDPKNWEKIFQPFLRFDTTTRGAGLGLSNAREFIRLMGGSLKIERSEPGVGTTFLLMLPAAGRMEEGR